MRVAPPSSNCCANSIVCCSPFFPSLNMAASMIAYRGGNLSCFGITILPWVERRLLSTEYLERFTFFCVQKLYRRKGKARSFAPKNGAQDDKCKRAMDRKHSNS